MKELIITTLREKIAKLLDENVESEMNQLDEYVTVIPDFDSLVGKLVELFEEVIGK